ncbi:MAG: 4-hydroxy-tetrahydrodipicolinate synthase [Verrucomicrobiales bacterium]|nr:4-hydroxy-tetrahydrodipicolinate synthase [Verrucomicrobiales bacterium]
MFAGVHTALVTPFLEDFTLDADAFRAIIDDQLDNGVAGIVPCGTTGESPTLTHEEHVRVIQLAVRHTAGRGIVIAGTGSNSTTEAINLTQAAELAGADASLQVAPYYNKPSQDGLYRHFRAIAQSTELPIMLYSIPGRCVIEIEVDTVARLAEDCSNIVAIKEAGGRTERVTALRAKLPDDFQILSGDDGLTVPFMKEGACGVVSVTSNILPKVMADLVSAMADGNTADAESLHAQYEPLFNGMLGIDVNPVPIKAALALAGKCNGRLRLPLCEMAEEKVADLRKILESAGVELSN